MMATIMVRHPYSDLICRKAVGSTGRGHRRPLEPSMLRTLKLHSLSLQQRHCRSWIGDFLSPHLSVSNQRICRSRRKDVQASSQQQQPSRSFTQQRRTRRRRKPLPEIRPRGSQEVIGTRVVRYKLIVQYHGPSFSGWQRQDRSTFFSGSQFPTFLPKRGPQLDLIPLLARSPFSSQKAQNRNP